MIKSGCTYVMNGIELANTPNYDYLNKMRQIQTEDTFINSRIGSDKLVEPAAYRRVYYCEAIRSPSRQLIAYFDRKFVGPANPK